MERKQGKLIWITGLPASGKTTIAKGVYKKLSEKYSNLVHLDGDDMRSIWGIWAEKSPEGRKKMAMSYAKQCSLLTSQGIHVIMSTVCLFHDIHDYNSKNNQYYYEILIESDGDVLDKRHNEDTSDKLKKERWKETSHEIPKNPALVLKNNTEDQIDGNVKKILDLVDDF